MYRRYEKKFRWVVLLITLHIPLSLLGQDFLPSLTRAPDTGKPFITAPASFISDTFYSISHKSSFIGMTVLNLSSGTADITLTVTIDPWVSRNSEGIFLAEYWIENRDPSGELTIAAYSGVIPINVNSGTTASPSWIWNANLNSISYGSTFSVFGYCYMYNQGGGQQGEYALYSNLGSVCVPFPTAMQLPTSESSTLDLGQPFTPLINSLNPTTTLLYQVNGQTSLQDASTPWISPAAGNYTFQVAQVSDPLYYGNTNDSVWGNIELNPTHYTLTVSALSATQVASSNSHATIGSPWSPTYTNLNPLAGPAVFCVVGETNFGSAGTPTLAWTPDKAGTYTFYVGQQIINPQFNSSVTDPNLGPMVVNPSAYTLTVPSLSQSVSSIDSTIPFGSSFTPTYITGENTGSNHFQFCIFNYTNFDGGLTLHDGTLDESSQWVSSWTAHSPGKYTFAVAEDQNDQFSANNPGTLYTLTVTDIPYIQPTPITSVPAQPVTPVITTSPVIVTTNSASQTFSQINTNLNTTVTTLVTDLTSNNSTPQQIQTPRSSGITRIRFNSLGHDSFISAGGKSHNSYLWTDPTAINTHPWPSFSNPAKATSNFGSTELPATNRATILHH